jgi:NAD(P)H-dependent FMN reductase
MKIFSLAASFRAESLNAKLLEIAAAIAEREGASVDRANARMLDLPLYDGDIDAASGQPAAAMALGARIAACDGLLIASPEYNFSLPGVLKNAIDWLSRAKPMVLKGKRALLLSASPSLVGGNRGLWALRVPLEAIGVHVYPDMFSLASAPEAMSDDALKDPMLAKLLDGMVTGWVAEGKRLAAAP